MHNAGGQRLTGENKPNGVEYTRTRAITIDSNINIIVFDCVFIGIAFVLVLCYFWELKPLAR